MRDLLARLLLQLLQPVGLALARWRFASLDRRQRRLVARLLTRRRYSRLLQIYAMPTPLQQVANYVQSTLSVGCTNVATSITVTSAAGLPTAGNFMLRIDDVAPATTFELVEVTAVAGAVLTVVRGQESTTGIAHNAGAFVGNDLTAGMLLRAFAWGLLTNGYAQVVATQGTFTVPTDITGLTVTVTPGTGRRIRVSAYVMGSSSVAGDSIQFAIFEGATQLVVDNKRYEATGFGLAGVFLSVILAPTAAAHTYKIQMARGSGTGNITSQAGATFPAYIMAEDIGPA